MRRARISIKPTLRPGGRTVAPTAENKSSQESAAVDRTQQTLLGDQTDRPSPSSQPHLEVIEPAVATGDGNVPGCPSEKASVNIGDGVPSGASAPVTTALQRRNRISATPNLARPKSRSVPPPPTGKTASLSLVSSLQTAKSISEAPVPVAISRDDSQTSAFSDSINKQTPTKTTNGLPSSPCLLSSSGWHEPSVPGSPSFPQPQQKPCQTPKQIPIEDSGSQRGSGPASCTLSPYVKLSRFDGPGSPLKNLEMSDKQRVLRALKLKELMKLERRKEIMKRKSGRCKSENIDEMDPSKMTLADFIYYLPETNPMRSSLSTEQTQADTVVPPSPKVLTKLAETDEEDKDDEDGMMVPKVMVAEDGTLILDEESLTVRVQRTSDTVVENAAPLFERGTATTYASFRKRFYVKSWSVRETDMFYLAMSMVGTDFSMMAQLLTHRTRAEIKSKFKKEEKTNAWRVDKAFKNKRPFDREFFSFLLKRILDKDKKRGRSVKLVVKANKAKRGGKKAKEHEDDDIIDDDDDEDIDDDELDIGDSLDLENENEDIVKVSDRTSLTSKKRKRQSEKTRKPRKNNKKSKKVEGEESECLYVEDDSVNAENEDPALMSKSKKTRKRSRKGEEKRCEEEPEKKHKTKMKKKTDKVRDEEPVDGDIGEANPSKKCKRSKKCKEEEKPAKGKQKTKKSKKFQEECAEQKLDGDFSEVSTGGLDAKEDQGQKLFLETAAWKETPHRSSKSLKRPLPNLPKRKAIKRSEQKPTVEDEDTAQETPDENCTETENESRMDSLAEAQLQKQAVVVLERTPPRLINAQSSCESPELPETSHSLQDSPGRQARAGKIKRNLTALERGREEPGKMDECQTGSGSVEDMRISAITCQEILQESKEMEADQGIEEGFNLHHLEFLTSSEVNGRVLLKRPVVLVSHEEVERYLRVQTAEENSTTSESQLDAESVESVEEHVDGPEGSCSSVILEERVSPDLEMKESASSSSQQKSSGFAKLTPNLSQTPQTFQRPLIGQTTESSENPDSPCSAQLQCSSPVEHTVKTVLNKCPDSPEEHATCAENFNDNVMDQYDALTSIDDDVSFTSDEETPAVNKEVVQEILSFLEKPQVLPSTLSDKDVTKRGGQFEMSQSQTCENKEQITDEEDCDSELQSKSKVKETVTEKPQKKLRRTIPTSCSEKSAEGSSVSTKHSITPKRCSTFCKPTPNLRQASQIHPQSERHGDSISEIADEPGCQSPAKSLRCEPDLNMKKISTEDKLVSSEVNLKERKQAEDRLSHVLLSGPKQTLGSTVSVDNTGIGNKEKSDPVLIDALSAPPETHGQTSAQVSGVSFSEAPNEHPSNTWDMNTMLFCESTAEDLQISGTFGEDIKSMGKTQPSDSDSVQQNSTENLSKASEDCSAPLKGNQEILDSAEVETDNQTEEEPTFILTLYEIPTSQLFQEASCGHQDRLPYSLQPAELHTPLFSGNSQPLLSTLEDSSSALLHMKSKEIEKPCRSDSQEGDSSIPVKDASTRLVSSQESSFDVADSLFGLLGSQEMLTYNASMPTDVTNVLKLEEKSSVSTETKAPPQRRSKIKLKPNLRPCMKVGSSKAGQSECASNQKPAASDNLATSHATQVEMESNQKTSAQETVGVSVVPNIHSNFEDSERRTHPLHEGTPRTGLQMGEDTVVDFSVIHLSDVPDLHSTAIEESKEEVEDSFEGVLNSVLASGEMKDKRRLQKCEDSESERPLPTANDQKEKVPEPDTDRESSSVTSASQGNTAPFRSKLRVKPEFDLKRTCAEDGSVGQEQSDIGSNQSATTPITLEPQIKEESDDVEQRSGQEEFSDYSKRDLDTMPTLTEKVMKTKQQPTPFTAAKTSTCAETKAMEGKNEEEHEDVMLPEMSVSVSEGKKDEVHMESRCFLPLQLCSGEDQYGCAVESQQRLGTEAEHECVSHMVLADKVIPISEKVGDDLGKERMTGGEENPHEAERSQVKEYPDGLLCAVSESTNVGPYVSPKEKTPTRKGTLKVKMMFPKRRSGELTESVEQSQTALEEPPSTLTSKQQEILTFQSKKESHLEDSENLAKNVAPFKSKVLLPWQQSTQCSVKKTLTCADSPSIGSEDTEEACEGVSYLLSDVLIPVLDETTESSLHKETLLVSLQDSQGTASENALKDEESVTERLSNTERKDLTASPSVSTEQNTPSCRREKLQKTAVQSMDPQAEEDWTLKSHMLPIDSNEIENWCEGVSHMLLSDAFVPVSEEENSTNSKVLVASGPNKEMEYVASLPENEAASENANKAHQLDSISGMQKSVEKLPASQAKNSPERQSTLHMTLRSPDRSPKNQPYLLKSSQAVSTTPKRAKTSKEKLQSPKTQREEVFRECRIQLERLSLEEICQHDLQPKHHSTPVNVKSTYSGNESRHTGLESHAAKESAMSSGCWPKVVLNRIKIKGADANSSTPTSSPARVSTTASRPLGEYQSPYRNPHDSSLDADEEPALVSQFFLDDIFTEVDPVDSDF